MSRTGQNIRKLRFLKKLSQAELAQKAGLSQGIISGYESGKKNPKLEHLRRLANALDVSVAAIDESLLIPAAKECACAKASELERVIFNEIKRLSPKRQASLLSHIYNEIDEESAEQSSGMKAASNEEEEDKEEDHSIFLPAPRKDRLKAAG